MSQPFGPQGQYSTAAMERTGGRPRYDAISRPVDREPARDAVKVPRVAAGCPLMKGQPAYDQYRSRGTPSVLRPLTCGDPDDLARLSLRHNDARSNISFAQDSSKQRSGSPRHHQSSTDT